MLEETSQPKESASGEQGTALNEPASRRRFPASTSSYLTLHSTLPGPMTLQTDGHPNPWAGPGRHDELALTAAVEVADSSSLLRPPPDRLFVSHAFETRTREALQEFGAELLDSVSTWSELRGVIHGLYIHHFQSVEEPDLFLTRVELRVPGVPHELQFSLWERLGISVEQVHKKVARKLGSSPIGRAYRAAATDFSTAVLPW